MSLNNLGLRFVGTDLGAAARKSAERVLGCSSALGQHSKLAARFSGQGLHGEMTKNLARCFEPSKLIASLEISRRSSEVANLLEPMKQQAMPLKALEISQRSREVAKFPEPLKQLAMPLKALEISQRSREVAKFPEPLKQLAMPMKALGVSQCSSEAAKFLEPMKLGNVGTKPFGLPPRPVEVANLVGPVRQVTAHIELARVERRELGGLVEGTPLSIQVPAVARPAPTRSRGSLHRANHMSFVQVQEILSRLEAMETQTLEVVEWVRDVVRLAQETGAEQRADNERLREAIRALDVRAARIEGYVELPFFEFSRDQLSGTEVGTKLVALLKLLLALDSR